MTNAQYIARPTESIIEGVPGFMIYDVPQEDETSEYNEANKGEPEEIIGELVSRISIKEVEGRYTGRPGYAIVRKKMPSNTIDEILDFMPKGKRFSEVALKSVVADYTLEEIDRLYEESNRPFDVEDFLNSLGLQTRSKEVYPGMENLFLKEYEKKHPEYSFLIREYIQNSKSRRSELVSGGASSEE